MDEREPKSTRSSNLLKAEPLIKISKASLAFGDKTLWKNLNLEVNPGEFIAVIGSNGSGKTVLLKTILGQLPLSSGEITVIGKPVRSGSRKIGYIPQHRAGDLTVPLRAKDLLRFGVDGHRFGFPFPSKQNNQKVDQMLAKVGASELAKTSISQLSGGQLQRIRVAQAVIDKPSLLLADEPLSALDLKQQGVVAELINDARKENNSAILFVTHDVNPILEYIDRVLYLANGNFKIGTPDEVLRSDVLSKLYGRPVDVVRNQGRIAVLGSSDHDHHDNEVWR